MPGQSTKDFLTRTALDVNDLKFDYRTLIIDENAVIDKQQKEKQRKENIMLDPFMKEFLSRKGSTNTTATTRFSPRSLGNRKTSVQIDDVKNRMS